MKSKLKLYPEVAPKGRDFSKCEIITQPNQAMTLQEIIKRFTRGEKLPVKHEGQYETRFGDLEKFKNQDLTEQADRATELKGWADKQKQIYEAQETERKKLIKEKRDQKLKDLIGSQMPKT